MGATAASAERRRRRRRRRRRCADGGMRRAPGAPVSTIVDTKSTRTQNTYLFGVPSERVVCVPRAEKRQISDLSQIRHERTVHHSALATPAFSFRSLISVVVVSRKDTTFSPFRAGERQRLRCARRGSVLSNTQPGTTDRTTALSQVHTTGARSVWPGAGRHYFCYGDLAWVSGPPCRAVPPHGPK